MKKETREKQKLNIRLTNLKSNLNSQRAITLIALIVTIIVLLILAGVSLNIVLGDNGIISKSKEAVNKYGESVIKEKEDMDKLYNILLSEKGELPDDPDKVKATGIQLAQTTAELGVGETLNLATGLTIEPENGLNVVFLNTSVTSIISSGFLKSGLSEPYLNIDSL